MFEMQVRADLSNRQVIQGVQASAYATSAQTQTALNAFMQRREVQILNFPVTDYLSKVTVSDVDLQTYYEKIKPNTSQWNRLTLNSLCSTSKLCVNQ